jgi:polar amino acid transport system permease protein
MQPGSFFYEAWISGFALLSGLGVTINISALTITTATALGIPLGLLLTFGPWPLAGLARIYIDLVRGIPVLVLVLFTYYGLALFKLVLSPFTAGVIALSVYAAAYVAEIVRGGLQSIPLEQHDAAKAIGLRLIPRIRYVLLPQALRRMLPPWLNTCLEIVKNTTLLSTIGVVELLLASQQVIARSYLILQFYLAAATIYLMLSFALSQLGRLLERRFSHFRY